MSYEGSCLCRKVAYRVGELNGPYVYCHCPSCRKSSGSAFGANISAPINSFEVVAGHEFIAVYESSPKKYRHFCRVCGSPLFTRLGENPSVVRIRLGSLDTAFDEPRSGHIFVGDKSNWYEISDSAPQFDAWPDPAVMTIRGSNQNLSPDNDTEPEQ